jgi:hypothetical protein
MGWRLRKQEALSRQPNARSAPSLQTGEGSAAILRVTIPYQPLGTGHFEFQGTPDHQIFHDINGPPGSLESSSDPSRSPVVGGAVKQIGGDRGD